ncbi:YggT family protein [Pseudothauera nasutitermitis]|uniref:YggT family protein n=1 Tax=Pseudothauera nasutitermitis TaxID=2565930 RepID=A0A4V3WBM8_9RHOO|nr:YggT family protein [Pseudothauera nasutitermitis]THF63853.1 YggT family protein [Pseudothauera nasutitermitis]
MLGNILLLILDVAVGLLTLLLLARFLLQWARVPFHNQIGQFVLAATDWLVRPLRRFIPGLFGMDLASLLPAWVLQTLLVFIELSVRGMPLGGDTASVLLGLWVWGLVGVVRMLIYLVFGIVLISAVLSWVSPHAPAAPLFHRLAEPFLRPFRRLIPLVANVDLSPLALLLVLQILLMLIGGLRGAFAPLLFGG